MVKFSTSLGLLLVILVAALTLTDFVPGYFAPFIPSMASSGDINAILKVPPGFSIKTYAADVPGARSLALSPSDTLFVGSRDQGNVYAVLDHDDDRIADEVITLASGLNMPNGVALKDGDLYVAEINRVLRFPNIEDDLRHPPRPQTVTTSYPSDRHHGWKFIRFGPDGKLYVPVGAPCNICLSKDEIYASITRLDVKTGEYEQYAQGVRNTVGFDWNPKTGELWFTDNGRDWLGDDSPPDELNRAAGPGLHFGYPFCHGKAIPDPEFGKSHDCSEFNPAALELGAHVASLGMRFYRGNQFPQHYRSGIFIAEHGSWNRKVPTGYRVMFVAVQDNLPVSYEVFASGWLDDHGVVTGRPVDVQEMPDGSLLVSDDKGGRIYRISYRIPAS